MNLIDLVYLGVESLLSYKSYQAYIYKIVLSKLICFLVLGLQIMYISDDAPFIKCLN